MHAGIYKPTESTQVSSDADSVERRVKNAARTLPGLKSVLGPMRSRGWNGTWAPTDDVHREHENTRTDEKED